MALVGLLGLLAGLLYSVNPTQFMSRGLGEVAIFFAFGPLVTWGTYYVMTNQLTVPAFCLGFPLGFLITAIIWINEFPDYPADKEAGKRNLVVRLGLYSSTVHLYFIDAPALPLFFSSGGDLCYFSLLPDRLAGPPPGLEGPVHFWRHYAEPEKIVPAQALTIQTHLALGLLMMVGLPLGRIMG